MSLASGYGGSNTSSAFGLPGAGPSLPTYTPPKEPDQPSPGHISYDFTEDPASNLIGAAGDIGRFLGTIPGVNLIGQIAQPIFSGIGDLGIGPGMQVKDVGSIVGSAFSALSIPGQMFEEANARDRLNNYLSGKTPSPFGGLTSGLLGGLGPSGLSGFEELPSDIIRRLRAGESVDDLAKEMASGGRGWSSNLTKELGASVISDPMNLLSFGLGWAGKAAKVVQIANAAGKADELGVVTRLVGSTYNLAVAGTVGPVRAVVKAALGPATSGVVKAMGPRAFAGLLGRIGSESPLYRSVADEAMGSYNEQMLRATIGRRLLSWLKPALKETVTPEEVEQNISRLVAQLPKSAHVAKLVEGDAEQLVRLKQARFLGVGADELRTGAVRELALVLRAPEEAAIRILGRTVTLQERQIVRNMLYGRLAKDLAETKATWIGKTTGTKASRLLQMERVTAIAPDTLTQQRAAAIISGAAPVPEAVDTYSILADKFLGGVPYADKDVVAYIEKLVAADALPEEVLKGLPVELKDWTARYGPSGYSIGYSPKSGWKVVLDAEGELVAADPFIHLSAGVSAVGVRNPLGRFSDSLFAAIHQRTLVLASEQRLQRLGVELDTGLSPGEAVNIHRAILRESFERQITPRALALEPAKDPQFRSRVSEIFHDHMGQEAYDKLIAKARPEFLFFKAFEGNVGQVGLTQKFTGGVKTAEAKRGGRRFVTAISESLAPAGRFKYNPFFQTQELVETAPLKYLRGITQREIDPVVRETIGDVFASNPDFRVFEEYGSVFLGRGQRGAQELVAQGVPGIKAKLGNIFDVAGRKRDAAVLQTFVEHAEWVEKAMLDIDPAAWAAWAEHAGSTDAHDVVAAFLKERQALASGEEARLTAEITRAKNAAMFGAIEAKAAAVWSPDMETFWQAYTYSLRKSSQAAWQTQFFRQGRGWLERTLNHPFLGLYPLSYASKIWMEFARFFLVRPFGLRAPLLGLDAMTNIQQALLADEMGKGELSAFAAKNPALVNIFNQLLPYNPTDVSIGVPPWMRDLATQAERGAKVPARLRTQKNQNVTVTDASRALLDQSSNWLNPLRIVGQLSRTIDEADAYFNPEK